MVKSEPWVCRLWQHAAVVVAVVVVAVVVAVVAAVVAVDTVVFS